MEPISPDFQFILENVNDHVVYTNPQGIIKYVNPSFLVSSGYAYEEVVGKNMNILKSGFHPEEFYKLFWKTISSGEKFSGIFKNKRKNGDFFWVNKTVTPVKKEGVLEGYLSISFDFTGELAYETKLSEEFEFSSSIIETSQALICVLDPKGNFILINKACELLSGFKKEELLGKHYSFLLLDEEKDRVREIASSLIQQVDQNNKFVNHWKTKTGDKRLISWSNSTIKKSDNSTKCVIAVGVDITEEYKTRLALSDLNKNLQTLVSERTTELEKINLELKSNKLFLDKIIETVPAIIYTINIETKKVSLIKQNVLNEVNPFYPEPITFSLDFIKNAIHPDDLDVFSNQIIKMTQEEVIGDIEFRVRGLNGNYYWLLRKSFVYETNPLTNKTISRIGFLFDINDRKNAELRALESEKRLEEAQRIAHVGNWDWDMITNDLYWSDEIYNIFGFEPKMFLPSYPEFLKTIYPDDVKIVTDGVEQALRGEKEYDVEHRIITCSGKIKYVRERGVVYYDKTGKPARMMGTVQDISRQKEIELSLIKSEQKYRGLYQNATVGIFKTNIITQKPVEANDVCIKLFGYKSKEDFLENFYASKHYFDEKDREFVKTEMPKRNFIDEVEMKFKKVNGDSFWGQMSARYLPETNEIEGVVIDITKRILFEEELKKTIEEKELLLKEVHHRVKNNLQTVSGLLLLQINKIKDHAVLEPLHASRDRIVAISLVHEKLYQSQNLSNICFKKYLEDLINMLRQTHSDKDALIEVSAENINLNIESAIPLGLIFHEFISNSFKHGYIKGRKFEITIKIEHTDNGALHVKYADNGKGFGVNGIVNEASLGMKLIDGLIKELGGRLEIQSEPGTGCLLAFNAKRKRE